VAGLVNRKPRRCTSPIGPFDRAARTLCNTRVPSSFGMSQNAQRWYGTRSPTGFESHRMEDRPIRPHGLWWACWRLARFVRRQYRATEVVRRAERGRFEATRYLAIMVA
jgi:hypothetical protein